MYQLTALYAHPEDVMAFDAHYDGVHAPLARRIPGLLRYTVSRPGPDADGNKPPYHLVAVLDFADAPVYRYPRRARFDHDRFEGYDRPEGYGYRSAGYGYRSEGYGFGRDCDRPHGDGRW